MKKNQPKKRAPSASQRALSITNLHVSVGSTPVVHGVSMTVRPGEIHILMGPNGSGKSTFLNALLGNPRYTLSKGTIRLGSKNLTHAPVFERARAGLFLGFQEPAEIPGLHIGSFLRAAKNALLDARKKGQHLTPMEFSSVLKRALDTLHMDERFGGRALNDGFSGGEKKKSELLQMEVLQPTYAFLDEFDSGLDIDALKVACTVIRDCAEQRGTGYILVSHNPWMLDMLPHPHVHSMVHGRIVATGGKELVQQVQEHGYEQWEK